MKRTLVLAIPLAAFVGTAATAYQAAARDREYRAQLSEGEAALRTGQTYRAIEAFSGAIALRPDSMLAHLRRGEAYQQRDELPAAARDYRRAVSLDPSATRPLEALGDVHYARGRYERAAELHEAHLRLDDQSARGTYKLALARYRAGDAARALEALDRTLELTDSLPDAYYLQGLCLRQEGRLQEALRALERAVALAPGLVAAREELADVYRLAGRRADHLQQLQMLAGLDGARADRQVALAFAQSRAGRGELAVLTLGSALERAPDEPLIYSALGRVWLDIAIQDPDRPDAPGKALEALVRAAAAPAVSSETLTLYGRALLLDDQAEAAERVLQQATRRYPADPDSFAAFAAAAERRGHFEAARAALVEQGALLDPDDEPEFSGRAAGIARLSLRLNEPRVAVRWYARAAARDPGNLELIAALADAQLRAGDRDGARATIAAALRREPTHSSFLALARRAGVS